MDLESLVNWESPRFPGSRSSYDECGIILYTKTGLSAHASKEDAREQGKPLAKLNNFASYNSCSSTVIYVGNAIKTSRFPSPSTIGSSPFLALT